MSRRRKLALLAVGAGHLGLVSMGALHVDVGDAGALGRAAAYYGRLSGAGNQYGFFAPDVEAVPWVVFEVNEDDMRTTDVLETGASHDADFRARLLGYSLFLFDDVEVQRAVAASMAGKIFARHPAAESVTVRALSCWLPTMDEYRAGERPDWDIAYEATFTPRANAEVAP